MYTHVAKVLVIASHPRVGTMGQPLPYRRTLRGKSREECVERYKGFVKDLLDAGYTIVRKNVKYEEL